MLLLLDIGKSQGKSDFLRSGKSLRILCQVREFPNFCSKSGNLSEHHSKLCSFMARIIILQSVNYLMVSEKAVSSGLVCVFFFKFQIWIMRSILSFFADCFSPVVVLFLQNCGTSWHCKYSHLLISQFQLSFFLFHLSKLFYNYGQCLPPTSCINQGPGKIIVGG